MSGVIGNAVAVEARPGADEGGLLIEGLHVSVGSSVLLDSVGFALPAGGVTALVGPNGAGKSTLLRALVGAGSHGEGRSRLAGRIVFEGQELLRMRRRDRARLVALVEQESSTELGLTVRETVALGRIPHQGLWGGDGRRDARVVADALATAGVERFSERPVMSLSGGERQRVMVARALAQEPRLLLLDEPLNHLDIAASLESLELLRMLGQNGVTVLAALHDLSLALAHGDRAVVLESGRVVASGPARETLTTERIEEVYGVRGHRLTNPATGEPVLAFSRLEPPSRKEHPAPHPSRRPYRPPQGTRTPGPAP